MSEEAGLHIPARMLDVPTLSASCCCYGEAGKPSKWSCRNLPREQKDQSLEFCLVPSRCTGRFFFQLLNVMTHHEVKIGLALSPTSMSSFEN